MVFVSWIVCQSMRHPICMWSWGLIKMQVHAVNRMIYLKLVIICINLLLLRPLYILLNTRQAICALMGAMYLFHDNIPEQESVLQPADDLQTVGQ